MWAWSWYIQSYMWGNNVVTALVVHTRNTMVLLTPYQYYDTIVLALITISPRDHVTAHASACQTAAWQDPQNESLEPNRNYSAISVAGNFKKNRRSRYDCLEPALNKLTANGVNDKLVFVFTVKLHQNKLLKVYKSIALILVRVQAPYTANHRFSNSEV